MKTDDTEQVIATIVDIFASHGDEEYLGEPVTMSEHMGHVELFFVLTGKMRGVGTAEKGFRHIPEYA